jgi:hypothetical protein
MRLIEPVLKIPAHQRYGGERRMELISSLKHPRDAFASAATKCATGQAGCENAVSGRALAQPRGQQILSGPLTENGAKDCGRTEVMCRLRHVRTNAGTAIKKIDTPNVGLSAQRCAEGQCIARP